MKVVVVEDHLMFREAVIKACETDLCCEVLGGTGSGAEALELTSTLSPDLVILDLAIDGIDGFTVIERVHRFNSTTKILVISCSLDEYTIYRIERAHVNGYIDKSTSALHALKQAILALEQGKSYFSHSFIRAQKVLHSNPNSFHKLLSPWEQKFLTLIGAGFDDEEVGLRLGISAATVQSHRSHILRKLNISGTPKLIAYAVTHGFTFGTKPLPSREKG